MIKNHKKINFKQFSSLKFGEIIVPPHTQTPPRYYNR